MILFAITQILITGFVFYIYWFTKIPLVLSLALLINACMAIGIVEDKAFKKPNTKAKFTSIILLLITFACAQFGLFLSAINTGVIDFICHVLIFIINAIIGATGLIGWINGFKGDNN